MENKAKGTGEAKTFGAIVLGATGYVGAELIRLITLHPQFDLKAASSRSQQGKSLSEWHPHLAAVSAEARFCGEEGVLDLLRDEDRPLVVFSALPHGESAATLQRLIEARGQADLKVIDLAADFRLRSPQEFEEVYSRAHGAPELAERFACVLPDIDSRASDFAAHPGCFTTAVTLAARPFFELGLVEPRFVANCVTGSTGSGRLPKPGTHHPERHGNLRAYSPLQHRHVAEMQSLLSLEEQQPEVVFLPHSGPWARGIHATLSFQLRDQQNSADIAAQVAKFYEASPFVNVATTAPHLKHVIGTNQLRLGVAARGRELVVFSVIDNLTKGAAGGAIQLANRACGFDESLGLRLCALGWN